MTPITDSAQNRAIAKREPDSESVVSVATRIPRAVSATLLDLAFLPVAGALLLFMLSEPNFDPAQPKKNITPLLLLHGSGFNESEFIIGRQFLKNVSYGSVFSLNYDGLVNNDPHMGINDYAARKVRKKILEIRKKTGLNRLIVIGHSMGGLIGSCYAERLAKKDRMVIPHVITIATPWQGAPILDYLSDQGKAKRYKQMSIDNPFRKELVNTALCSEKAGRRKYYNIGSTTDFMVPAPASNLTEDPTRQRTFSYLGHYGLIVSPQVWLQVRSWLDAIYADEPVPRSLSKS